MTNKQTALDHYQAQAAQAKFVAHPAPMAWETYSAVARGEGCTATYVTGERGSVRLSWIEHRAQMAMQMTPEAARALAGELIAAADASQAPEVQQ